MTQAISHGSTVIPVYIDSSDEEGDWPPGAASKWWLHHALCDLDKSLRDAGSSLLIRRGNAEEILLELLRESGATSIYWNRRYELSVISRDTALKKKLKDEGVEAVSFNGSLLFEPHRIANQSGAPYRVFTPFWKYCINLNVAAPVQADMKQLRSPAALPGSLSIGDLNLLPKISWDGEMAQYWKPTLKEAQDLLRKFSNGALGYYEEDRDRPDLDGTSQLSPYLAWGQLSPRQIWHALSGDSGEVDKQTGPFLRQIVWREFAWYLLYHFPETVNNPMRPEFEHFPWQEDKRFLRCWQCGETGYPIVDAGMRQLWKIGWMHNRVRMVAASLLAKHLLQPWQAGAAWFWDTLVDADLANNTFGWQWVSGCGADAAPYFRIFNPITQGEKFDPEGDYVRKYVPELAKLPPKYIHHPWDAPPSVLKDAGVELGKSYPYCVIEHKEGRKRALEAFQKLKEVG